MAHVEAYIDFSEDDNIEDGVLERTQLQAATLLEEIQVKNISITISAQKPTIICVTEPP